MRNMRIFAGILAVTMMFMLPLSAGCAEAAAADAPVVVLRVAVCGLCQKNLKKGMTGCR